MASGEENAREDSRDSIGPEPISHDQKAKKVQDSYDNRAVSGKKGRSSGSKKNGKKKKKRKTKAEKEQVRKVLLSFVS